MKETVYTRTLVQAAEAEGSTQALAHLLRVPENTLLRWMESRAQMPVKAFLKAIDVLQQQEKRIQAGTAPERRSTPAGTGIQRFPMGELLARCARCDGTDFRAVEPQAPLRMTAELSCIGCAERVIHGDLISQLATDAIQHLRAMASARRRRHQAAKQASAERRSKTAPR